MQAGDAAAVVKAYGVVVGKRVALAGDHEVFVAVQPQLDRAVQFVRRNSCPHSQVPRLGFFAAKATAHASAFDPHRVVGNAQRMGDPVLHFTGVLRAGVHRPLVLLLRHHVGDLAFQVEMLLTADFQFALQGVGCFAQCGGCIAAFDKHGRQHIAFLPQGRVYIQHGRQAVDAAHHLAGSAPRLHDCFGHHHTHDLPHVLHGVLGKYRLIACKRGQHALAWHITRQHHVDHARHGQRCRTVNADQPAVGYFGHDGRGIQRALQLGDVVNIRGSTGDLSPGTFMKTGLASGVHSVASNLKLCRLICWMPWLCSQKRCKRLPKTCTR